MVKEFLQTKEAKRAGWTILNTLMTLVVSYIVFLASNSVAWAISILPFVQAISQFITKTYVKR